MRDDNVITSQPSPHHHLPSTPPILFRLHFDFSLKTRLYLRLLTFLVIEASYIILATICLAGPIPLYIPFNLTNSEVRGGFTVIFVVWQLLAIFIASSLVTDAFSREWSTQLKHYSSGTAGGAAVDVPNGIDRASVITAGFFNHTHHLLVGKSSGTFKLAFLASLFFVALSSLGPGAINVGVTLVDEPTTVQIGRLLGHAHNITSQVVWTVNRAKLILQVEKIERLTFGFKLPPNMLVPVPKVDLASFNGTIEYDSDVIEFHYDCHWEAPHFLNIAGEDVVESAGQQWAGAIIGTDQTDSVGSSIAPLRPRNASMMEQASISAYLFSGGNTSILNQQPDPPVPFAVDLGTLPATFVKSGVSSDQGDFSVFAPLSSILVCDPGAQITGGRVRVTNDGTLKVIALGNKPFGNIQRSAANWIFTSAFLNAMNIVDIVSLSEENFVTDIATSIFVPNPSTVNWNDAYGIHPLDLPSINQNVDAFMLSAAKAYIDGSKSDGSKNGAGFDLDTVSAVGQREKLALMASKRLFLATVALVGMATLLLFGLSRSALAPQSYPFDWVHIVEVFGEDQERKPSLVVRESGKI